MARRQGYGLARIAALEKANAELRKEAKGLK